MSFVDLYSARRMSADDAVDCIRDGDRIMVPTGVGEPPGLLTALSNRRHQWRGVSVSQILAMQK
jgi:acyl-CoA hydrolase